MTTQPQPFEPARLSVATFRREIYDFIAPRGLTPEQILEPGRWMRMAQLLKPWDHVELRSDEGSFYAELLVTAVDANGVHFAILPSGVSLGGVGAAGSAKRAESGEYIKHLGPFQQWAAVRGEGDKMEVIQDQFKTEALAASWLGSYLATVSKGAA